MHPPLDSPAWSSRRTGRGFSCCPDMGGPALLRQDGPLPAFPAAVQDRGRDTAGPFQGVSSVPQRLDGYGRGPKSAPHSWVSMTPLGFRDDPVLNPVRLSTYSCGRGTLVGDPLCGESSHSGRGRFGSEPSMTGTYLLPPPAAFTVSVISTVLEESPHGCRVTFSPDTAVVATPTHRPLSTP